MGFSIIISEKVPKIAIRNSVMVKMGEDEVLFSKVKTGDEEAFEQLFKQYYSTLCHYACKYVMDMDEAEEIVQSIYLRIWERKEKIDIETSFKSYIYQSVRNKCLNAIRNQKNQNNHLKVIDLNDYEDPVQLDQLTANEINEQLFAALEELPPKCKQIFQLSRFEDLRHQEIADMLDLKVKTIENQIGIALKFLKERLSEYLHTLVFLLFNLF